MDPQNTMLSYFDFPPGAGDGEDAHSPLSLQNPYMTYPSPISPPSQFLGHQLPVQSPSPMTSPYPSSPPVTVTPNEEDTTTILSLSTVFHPGAHAIQPDLTFISSDMVLFYVHSQVLKSVSPRVFRRAFEAHRNRDKGIPKGLHQAAGSSVSPDELIHIPDTSSVLNIILHLLYGTSPAQHSPTFETLTTAVDRMPYYNLTPKNFLVPRNPLYDLLLTQAPLFPLQLYTLAARHDLQEMAVATSSHLLSYPLTNLPDEAAERMGALYLKRLFCLHLERFNALKQILLSPPQPHPAMKECTFVDQKKLTRAWALVSAYLAWDARPDLSTHSMRNAFQPLIEDLSCDLCKEGLQKRIRDIIVQWASVKIYCRNLHLSPRREQPPSKSGLRKHFSSGGTQNFIL